MKEKQLQVDGAPRDFSPEDATIELSSPRVIIDGKNVASAEGGISGEAVWIDLPGHGRFVFSLAPRLDIGMQKTGEIRGTTMTWHAAGSDYMITTDKPIASGSRAYNLYVFHIPRNVQSFGMSAGARPEDPILRK